ncbi:hypothetical protein [Methylocella sp.]|uniref:hypothetical protein n=1 Tax=Methylocella sp. TaxID=1978226 RepID=UPI0035B0BE51
MTRVLAAFILAARAGAAWAQDAAIDTLRAQFAACRAKPDADERLACYDALQGQLERPIFEGRLSETTKPFRVVGPVVIRYQSDGPAFVMYLKDEQGVVVQNLHPGGGGERSFPFASPGLYTLQVNGADTWRIWIEPQRAAGAR